MFKIFYARYLISAYDTDKNDESAEEQASNLLEKNSQVTISKIQKNNIDKTESEEDEEQEQEDSRLHKKSSVTIAEKSEEHEKEIKKEHVKAHSNNSDTVKEPNGIVKDAKYLEVNKEKLKIMRESLTGDQSYVIADDIHQKVKISEQNYIDSEEDDVNTTEDYVVQGKSRFIKLRKVNGKKQKTSYAAEDIILTEDIDTKIKNIDVDVKQPLQEKSRFIKMQNGVKQMVEPLDSEETDTTDAEHDLPKVKTLPGKNKFVKTKKVDVKQEIEPEVYESGDKPTRLESKEDKSRFIKSQKVESDIKDHVSSPESPRYQPSTEYVKVQEKIKKSITESDSVVTPDIQQKSRIVKNSPFDKSAEEVASVPKIPKKVSQKPLEAKREDSSKTGKLAVSKFKVDSSRFEGFEMKHTTKTKSLAKQQEDRIQIPIIRRLEDKYADNNKQHVKQNIRKIIQKYKRRKMDEKYTADETVRARQHIRKIIEDERLQQQKEEINRIQEQIMGIIENNPKITNKNFIKSKLEETVIKELVNAIDLKVQSEATLKQFDMNEDQNKGAAKIYLPKMPEKFLSEERSEDDLSLLSRSDENYETGEVGTPIAIVEKPANVGEMIEEEKIAFVKKFKKPTKSWITS
nr:unnamed protein product [Callosobruchus analis]